MIKALTVLELDFYIAKQTLYLNSNVPNTEAFHTFFDTQLLFGDFIKESEIDITRYNNRNK